MRISLAGVAAQLFGDAAIEAPPPEPDPEAVTVELAPAEDGVAVALNRRSSGAYLPKPPILVTGYGPVDYAVYCGLDLRGSAPSVVDQLRALDEATA